MLASFTAFGESKLIRTPVPAAASAHERSGETPRETAEVGPEAADSSSQATESLSDWVGKSVATILGEDRVTRDSDGDIPIRYGSAMCYVRANEDPLSVVVFSPMVVQVLRSPALLEALNDINMNISVGRVFHTPDNAVVFALELYGAQLTTEILQASLDAATSIADHFDHDLQSRFGGIIRFAETNDDSVMM